MYHDPDPYQYLREGTRGNIRWEVSSRLGGTEELVDFNVRQEAEDSYEDLKASLEKENERVVLYRVKNDRGNLFRDARRCSIVDDQGQVLSLSGFAPKDWKRARRAKEVHFAPKRYDEVLGSLSEEEVGSISSLEDVPGRLEAIRRERIDKDLGL